MCIRLSHPELCVVLAHISKHCRRDHFLRVRVLWHRLIRQGIVACLLDFPGQIRSRPHQQILRFHIRQEGRANLCSVRIGYACVCSDQCAEFLAHCSADACQSGAEQEELDPPLAVEIRDLANDRKRRIVHYHALRFVLVFFKISARIERSHEVFTLHAVFLLYPLDYGRIYQVWSVTVVRGLLGFKLLDELLVLFRLLIRIDVHPTLIVEPVLCLLLFRDLRPGDRQPARIKRKQGHVQILDLHHLRADHSRVPLRKLSDLIVCQPKCPDLFFRQIISDHTGHRLHPQLLCCLVSGMAADDLSVLLDDHRHLEAELLDAVGHIVHGLVVLPRVSAVWMQFSYAFLVDLHPVLPLF